VKEVIDEYYQKHNKQVYCYLYQLTGDADLSEELTQETFYQGMRTVKNYKGDCKPSVWLCQIAKHVWYQYLQKHRNEVIVSINDLEDKASNHSMEHDFWNRQDKIELYKRINSLSKGMREVVYLRLSGDLSFAEIAEILDKTENWARVNFYRAKQELMKGAGK
jgi:RNA polymerase sigma factor (sigma-70 family)